MTKTEVTVARVYIHEGKKQVDALLKRLHDWEKVRGVTVFRGVAGYGDSGEIHTGKLVDLSLDLPVVVEFFDEPAKMDAIVEHLNTEIKPGHILTWSAWINNSE